MAKMPKIVILATAYVISVFFALIEGARATMAVAPQILVPTAINCARFSETLKKLFKYLTINIVHIIQGMITDRLFAPYK